MNSPSESLVIVLAMGAVIIACRAFPFLFFRGSWEEDQAQRNEEDPVQRNKEDQAERNQEANKDKHPSRKAAILDFVEKTVPPAAMTVLAFNALGVSFRENTLDGTLVLAASVFTALIHLWKRNSLISIFGGTALYMILERIVL